MSSSIEESGNGFFDKFVAKIKQLSSDDNNNNGDLFTSSSTAALPQQVSSSFDQSIPPSGLLSSTSKFSLTSATDTNNFISQIQKGTHTAPNAELPKILDDTFADVAEAIKLIDVAINNERYNLQLAQKRTKDHAKPLSDSIAKELAAVERYLQLNLRIKIEKKNKKTENKDVEDVEDQQEHQRKGDIHLEMYKKWTEHEQTCAKKFEEIEEERKTWDDIIAKYEQQQQKQHQEAAKDE